LVKHIDIYFAYLLCSFVGFVLVWKFDDNLFVLFPRILLIVSIILFTKHLSRLINNQLGQLYVFCFVLFLFYYTFFGSSQPNLFVVYKPLIMNVFFNFLLGFTLVCLVNKISQRRKNVYIFSAFVALLFALLLVSTTGEPYYVVQHRIDLYQTLSDYMLRIVVFCTILLVLKKSGKNNHNIYILVFWILAFFISLISGAKKQLAIEVPMILVSIYYITVAMSIRLKLLAFIGCMTAVASILRSSNLLDGLALTKLGGMSYEKVGALIQRSIVDRIVIIEENFLNYLEVSNYIGNPWVHDLVGENYVHSSLLSLFTSFGMIFGLLITLLVTYTILSFKHNELRVVIMGYLIAGMSVIATFFDWMLLWFFLGIIIAYKSQHRFI
jgi:hypothetical protein